MLLLQVRRMTTSSGSLTQAILVTPLMGACWDTRKGFYGYERTHSAGMGGITLSPRSPRLVPALSLTFNGTNTYRPIKYT